MIDGKLSSAPVEIINMWFEHFKCLGISSTHNHYDSSFCDFLANTGVTKFKSVLTDKSNSFDITTSLPLKCGAEKQKDHLPKRRKRLGTS